MKKAISFLSLFFFLHCTEAKLDENVQLLHFYRLLSVSGSAGSGAATGAGTSTGTGTGISDVASKNFTFVTSYSVDQVIQSQMSDYAPDISADSTYLFISYKSYWGTYVIKLLPDQNSFISSFDNQCTSTNSALAVKNNKIYVGGNANGDICVHDYSGAKLSQFQAFDNSTSSGISSMLGMDFWTDTSLVLMTSSTTIYFVNTSATGTGNVTSKLTNTVGNAGITKFNDKLIVGNSNNKKIYLLNSSTGAVLDTIAIAQPPSGLVYFQNYLWVLCTDKRIYKYTVTP